MYEDGRNATTSSPPCLERMRSIYAEDIKLTQSAEQSQILCYWYQLAFFNWLPYFCETVTFWGISLLVPRYKTLTLFSIRETVNNRLSIST